jgi:type VI secretion system protein ImpI
MFLTFEVISANAAALGASRRKVFTVDGGKIGRSPENDMVLPGVGVHRHHATVRFINGVFFVEGVGTNGIAINDPDRVLPRNEPYPLKTGDKIFIDEYEVAVATSAAAPAEPAARAAPRPAPESTQPPARQGASSLGIPLEPGENAEDLDPLRKLSGAPPAAAPQRPASRPVESWNHSSSLADHFTPPPAAPPSDGGGNVIPENWDRTSFDQSKLRPAAPPPPHAAPPAPPPPAQPRSAAPTPQATPRPAGQPARAAGAPQPQGNGWVAFLNAAGVDPARVPPETAAALGNIMRSVVQGLIEVLRARSEIKTEFRMPVTQVKVSENNPLKFAANAEDALGNLLGRRNPAYLGPQEAFADALNDVRYHQLAMLAGVRAGFDNLMNRFDPTQLQEAFERQGKRRGLFGGGKATYWDRYAERYEDLSKDRDDTFRRLFGEEFARAYEQQLSVLKRNREGGT